MKILGQVTAILPLALIISLPNQLFAHVPITNISVQFTEFLESMESQDFETNLEGDDEEEEDRQPKLQVPELSDMFKVGQYVRAVVSAVHPPGASDTSGIGRSRDEASRASKRVELCLIPERVNFGVQKSDLKSGFARIILL
jgi:rRNA biogenesis protein RRP5